VSGAATSQDPTTALGAAAGNPATLADYQAMLAWRFATPAVPVPAGGIVITKDTATWTLESGRVALMAPVAGGRVTGLVFTGKGRFTMTIPDRFEVAQLRRFTARPEIERIDEPITRLVLRTTGPLPAALGAPPAAATYDADSLARDRHETWLERARLDADARVLAGLLTPGDDYLLVDADTAAFGWLLYEYDPFAQEEVSLYKFQSENRFVEQWVGLDRPGERDAAGRPTSSRSAFIHVRHVDIDVDLSRHSGSPMRDDAEPIRDKAFFRCTMTCVPLVSGPRVLPLRLDPLAEVKAVRTASGTSLPFARDHIGKRFSAVENEVYDGSLVVLLDHPLQKGGEEELVVEYEMKTLNFVSGRDWYPGTGNSWTDLHTARMAFSLPRKVEVRAVGTQESEDRSGDVWKSVWVVAKPTSMVGFSFGKGFKEERIKIDGAPEVVSFGTTSGLVLGNMVRNVGADVVNSLKFLQWYYDVRIPAERIWATGIADDHGQAFEGFLHLSLLTYSSEHPGASELFRAHEVAHQLWGHMVIPKSYRDNWLSEGFAEYTAMLFIEATMPKEKYFEEILDVYSSEQLGSLRSGMSKFARPWSIVVSAKDRAYVGPIAAGYRASAARVPGAAMTQTYNKGALVLHSLRSILSGLSRKEDLFRLVMQDFVREYAGREASTDDFRRVIEKRLGGNWRPFFDAWVYGTVVPTYSWSWDVSKSAAPDGTWDLAVTVKQSDVPEGFGTPVPLRVEFGDKAGSMFLQVKKPEETFHLSLPARPKNVIFNPRHAVIARVKE
jgi:hypothetical protein